MKSSPARPEPWWITPAAFLLTAAIVIPIVGGTFLSSAGGFARADASARLAAGESLARRVCTNLQRADRGRPDDEEFAECGDPTSAARYRLGRERLARVIGPVRDVTFVEMPTLDLADFRKPDSTIETILLVRGERGSRRVRLLRRRNYETGEWRVDAFEILTERSS